MPAGLTAKMAVLRRAGRLQLYVGCSDAGNGGYEPRQLWRSAEFPETQLPFPRLRDSVTPVGLHYIDVGILNPTVCVEILAEIGARHRLIQLALDEPLIGLGNNTIGVGVADKETKLDIPMRLPIAIDVLCMESYNLGRRHPGELCRHAIATEGNGSDRGAAVGRNFTRCDRGVEGKDGIVGRSATTFHPGDTS